MIRWKKKLKSNIIKNSKLYADIYTGFAILMILLIYSMIFDFSSKPAVISSYQSMTLAEKIVETAERFFSIDLSFNDSEEQLDRLETVIRKAAHFFEYTLLGAVTFSIIISRRQNRWRGAAGSFFFVVFLAAADEFHQSFVPGRYSSIWDVCIDGAGCIAGILLLWGITRFFERPSARMCRSGPRWFRNT